MERKATSLKDFSDWISNIATAASLVSTPKFKVEEKKGKKWSATEYVFAATPA